jgi:hypothetical protein
MRLCQAATGLAFMGLAALAMFDSRAGALVDRSGGEPGGIGPGFYPFWSAALMFVAAGVVTYESQARGHNEGGIVFESRDAALAVIKLAVPMIAMTVALVWLGFYIVSGAFMGLFARWIGRYNWLWVVVLAVAMPLAIYLTFETGFRVTLPKSVFYEKGLLPI